MDGGMKLSIQLKLSAAWAAAGATLSLAIFPFGLRSGLIREAINKMSHPLIVVLFVPENPAKVNGFVTLSEGWVGV